MRCYYGVLVAYRNKNLSAGCGSSRGYYYRSYYLCSRRKSQGVFGPSYIHQVHHLKFLPQVKSRRSTGNSGSWNSWVR